jgi:hypothetical protein
LLYPLPEGVIEVSENVQADFVLFFVGSQREVQERVPQAVKNLKHDGLLWAAYPKKTSGIKTDISRDAGWEPMMEAGFEGVSLVGIDNTWSAIRFRPAALTQTSAAKRAERKQQPKLVLVPPPAFLEALNAVPEAKAWYEKMPPSHRKEYLNYMLEAKKEETRLRRIEKAIELLKKGKKLNG